MTKETLSDKIYDIYPEIQVKGELKFEDVRESIKKLTPQLFHKIYEEEADNVGWETQRKCRVKFDDLPETNQETMIKTIRKIKKEVFGDKLL